MAKSILLGLCATAIIPLPLAEAVATNKTETVLPTTVELNNDLVNSDLVKSCPLESQVNSCLAFNSKNLQNEKIYSDLWLHNIVRVLLSGSMFQGCKTSLKPNSNFLDKQSLAWESKTSKLDCIFTWQNSRENNKYKRQNQDFFLPQVLSNSHSSKASKKPKLAIETTQKFPKLSRSSLVVSYPKLDSTFQPKETKLANPAPETKRIASPFGWRKRPYSYQLQFHQGIDYGAPLGSPVVAVGNGIVTKVVSGCYDFGSIFCGGQLGNWIEIDHGDGRLGIYGHLKRNSITVKEGMKVQKNQKIARVGSSGWSTGAHLDFRFKINGNYEDPAKYVTVPSDLP